MKKCPFCAEQIPLDTERCPYCDEVPEELTTPLPDVRMRPSEEDDLAERGAGHSSGGQVPGGQASGPYPSPRSRAKLRNLLAGLAIASGVVGVLISLAGNDTNAIGDSLDEEVIAVSTPSGSVSASVAGSVPDYLDEGGSPNVMDYSGEWRTLTLEGLQVELSVWNDAFAALALTRPSGEETHLMGSFSSTDGYVSLFTEEDEEFWGTAAIVRLSNGDVRVALRPAACPAGDNTCAIFLSPTHQEAYLHLGSDPPDDVRLFLRRNPNGNDIVRLLNDHVSNFFEGPADEALMTGLWWGLSDWCGEVSRLGEGRCYDLAAEFLELEAGLSPREFDDSDWSEIPGAAGSIVEAGYALAAEWLTWDNPDTFSFTQRPGVDISCVTTCEAAIGQ